MQCAQDSVSGVDTQIGCGQDRRQETDELQVQREALSECGRERGVQEAPGQARGWQVGWQGAFKALNGTVHPGQ